MGNICGYFLLCGNGGANFWQKLKVTLNFKAEMDKSMREMTLASFGKGRQVNLRL